MRDDKKVNVQNKEAEGDSNQISNDSKIMQSLNDYCIVPNEKTKRKLDYYYGPYHPGNNN